jgi:hypothetical protein
MRVQRVVTKLRQAGETVGSDTPSIMDAFLNKWVFVGANKASTTLSFSFPPFGVALTSPWAITDSENNFYPILSAT